MKYQLSESFTSSDKTPVLRLPDGTTSFRIISEDFLQCLSLFVKTTDGKGYSRTWIHSDPRPDLEAGHEYENRNPKKVVLFKVVTEAEPERAQILVAPITVTEQIFDEANELDGLTVCWMACKRSGSGMNTTYRIRSGEPTAYNPAWKELADAVDFSDVIG